MRAVADLEPFLRHHLEALGIPGAAVAVVDGDEVAYSCAGVTGFEHPLPIDPTTIFQIGSISKTFVATCAALLVEAGKLDLDEPVVTFVPDLRLSSDELTAELTTRHLLTHRSGWVGDHFADTGEGDDALARLVTKLAKAPQLTPLDSAYSYNNSGFNLAAHVVATVTGVTFERAVSELILRPLGMRRTTYSAEDAITRRVAIGHRDGRPQRWRRPRAHNGAGGVLSCVEDMARYAQAHLGVLPLLSAAVRSAMQTPVRPAGSLCDEVGLAWMLDVHAGRRLVHHGGTTNGYQADLRLVPDRGMAWVLLTNSHHHHQLDRLLREELLGPDDADLSHDPGDLEPFAGRYEARLHEVTIGVVDGGLVLDEATPRRALWRPDEEPPPPVRTRLAFRDADRVQALDMPLTGHRGEFVRDDTGAIAWFRWDGRIARRVATSGR